MEARSMLKYFQMLFDCDLIELLVQQIPPLKVTMDQIKDLIEIHNMYINGYSKHIKVWKIPQDKIYLY